MEADLRRALMKAMSGDGYGCSGQAVGTRGSSGKWPSVARAFLPRRIVVKADLRRAHQARDSGERARGTHGERRHESDGMRATHGERRHESDGLRQRAGRMQQIETAVGHWPDQPRQGARSARLSGTGLTSLGRAHAVPGGRAPA